MISVRPGNAGVPRGFCIAGEPWQLMEIEKAEAKPFFPRNKPRTWVICQCAFLVGLVIGLLVFASGWFGWNSLQNLGVILFFACGLIAVACWFVFLVRLGHGDYRKPEERKWRDQMW
jgi:hypothetical protein